MKLIDKYISSQVILYALLSMAVFVFVLVSGKVIRDGVELLTVGKVSMTIALELFLMLILYVFTYALPLGLLTAILLVLGRLSAQREITAFKAAGISLYRIALPILALAFIGSAFSLYINTYLAPHSKSKYKNNIVSVIQENPLQYLQDHTFIKDFPGYVLFIEEKHDNVLNNLWIWEIEAGRKITSLIKAETATFHYNKDKAEIVLSLENGTAERRHHSDPEDFSDASTPLLTFDQVSLKLPLKQLISQRTSWRKLSTFTLNELRSELKTTTDPTRRIEIKTLMQKSIATACSPLVLALLAIPLGIKASRKETYANLAIALILALMYYSLVIIITWLDDYPQLRPDLLIWIPNILFVSLGSFLLYKTNKH